MTSGLLAAIVAHARACYPNEACGLVFDDRFIPISNVSTTPRKAFRMDEIAVLDAMRESGREPAAIVHSHCDASAELSPEDRRMAVGADGVPLWPGVSQIVVSVVGGRPLQARIYRWDPSIPDFSGPEVLEVAGESSIARKSG